MTKTVLNLAKDKKNAYSRSSVNLKEAKSKENHV